MPEPEPTVREAVQHLYDGMPEREWERLERHRTEFAVTLRAFAEHLPAAPARVLDCGGGPGRYAIELARRGYEVTLFDLSPECLQLAREKASEAGVELAAYELGTACDLARFGDRSFDAVLLMGPLYHLLAREERLQALRETRRILVPGGTLCASFISRYAAGYDAAAKGLEWALAHREVMEQVFTTGELLPRGDGGFVAYFARPDEAEPLLREAGFDVATLLGVEGLTTEREAHPNQLTGSEWEYWVDLNYRLAHDPALHGAAEHLLAVAVDPLWRHALRRIASALERAGVPHRVAGGTSAALHGVPVRVRDIDVETTKAGAERFQALFPAEAQQSVAWQETEQYRSWFGLFDFDGVRVEVMGDTERREREGWTPTTASTEETVDLDGQPVRTTWLEEETLAYIRRGRLERAAACLPHCNQARLMALLRGRVETQVL